MPAQPRFLKMKDVSDVLSVTSRQVRTLLLSGELRGIQVGGRGEWRIEASELEKYIERQYAATDRLVEQSGEIATLEDTDESDVRRHRSDSVEDQDA